MLIILSGVVMNIKSIAVLEVLIILVGPCMISLRLRLSVTFQISSVCFDIPVQIKISHENNFPFKMILLELFLVGRKEFFKEGGQFRHKIVKYITGDTN